MIKNNFSEKTDWVVVNKNCNFLFYSDYCCSCIYWKYWRKIDNPVILFFDISSSDIRLTCLGEHLCFSLESLVIHYKNESCDCIITFSKYDEHLSLIFKQLDILKITDLLSLHNALLMYDFHYPMLPPPFDNFFKQVKM